jgi:hypothetical protein
MERKLAIPRAQADDDCFLVSTTLTILGFFERRLSPAVVNQSPGPLGVSQVCGCFAKAASDGDTYGKTGVPKVFQVSPDD